MKDRIQAIDDAIDVCRGFAKSRPLSAIFYKGRAQELRNARARIRDAREDENQEWNKVALLVKATENVSLDVEVARCTS